MMLKDTLGRRIYSLFDQFASELRVSSVVPVDVFGSELLDILAIIVNMNDYVIGADKGGQVSLFDDFDIDYNQYKYLIETRCSGALVKLKSALVFKQGNVCCLRLAGTASLSSFLSRRTSVRATPSVHGSLPDDDGTVMAALRPSLLANPPKRSSES